MLLPTPPLPEPTAIDALGREADLADLFRRPHVLDDAHVNFGVRRATLLAAVLLRFGASFVPQQAGPGRQAQRRLSTRRPSIVDLAESAPCARHAAAGFRDRANRPAARLRRHLAVISGRLAALMSTFGRLAENGVKTQTLTCRSPVLPRQQRPRPIRDRCRFSADAARSLPA